MSEGRVDPKTHQHSGPSWRCNSSDVRRESWKLGWSDTSERVAHLGSEGLDRVARHR